jgi:tetratricopeptide (TPR) repeat protein
MKKIRLALLLAGLLTTSWAYADNDAAWSNSYSLEASKKYAEALTALNAIPASGENAQLLLLRQGWLTYLQGQYNDSVKYYQEAMQQNPKSLDAVLGVTLPLLAQQRWQEAAVNAKQVLNSSPNQYTAYLRLIVAEEGARDWSAMKQHAEELTEHYPTDTSAFVYLARAYAWLGDKDAAKKAYNAVLTRLPKHYEATAYLAKNS